MALPNYGGRGGMLYDPSNDYGWGDFAKYIDTDPGLKDANDNPQSYYTKYAAEQGYNGLDARSTAVRGLYGRVADSYGAARLTNRNLRFTDFLGNIDFNQLLSQMSPAERGENPSNFAPTNVRWLPR